MNADYKKLCEERAILVCKDLLEAEKRKVRAWKKATKTVISQIFDGEIITDTEKETYNLITAEYRRILRGVKK